MGILFTILLGGFTWYQFKFFKGIMAPAVLFSLVWFASVLLHTVFSYTLLEGLFPLTLETHLLFAGGILAFSAGSIFVSLYANPSIAGKKFATARRLSAAFPPIAFLPRLIIVLACAILLPFLIEKAFELFVKSQVENFLVGLRIELTYGDEGLGALKYAVSLSMFTYAICQLESTRNPSLKNKVLSIVSLLLALTYATFLTGRGYYIMILFIYLGIQSMYHPKFSFRKLLWLLPVTVIAFTVFGLVYGKGGSFDDNFYSNLKSSSQNTALYFSGSLSAFDWETHHNFHVAFNGHNSLRFFYVIAASLGITGPIAFDDNLVQEFVFIPYETNVYTLYSPYVRDFGYFYPLIILFGIGLLHTYFYRRALQTGSPRSVIYYSLLLFPLIMSFFQDQYLMLLSTWLQAIVVIELVFLLNTLFYKKNKAQALPAGASLVLS